MYLQIIQEKSRPVSSEIILRVHILVIIDWMGEEYILNCLCLTPVEEDGIMVGNTGISKTIQSYLQTQRLGRDPGSNGQFSIDMRSAECSGLPIGDKRFYDSKRRRPCEEI